MNSRSRIVVGAALVLTFAVATIGKAKDQPQVMVLDNAVVHFGAPQPQGAPPAVTHLLLPDDVTIQKGGKVTFVVNGGGHGIAIHRVNKKTTRDDIAEDLCQGPPGTDESDRAARATVCNAALLTANKNYIITDGDGHGGGDIVIETGENPPNPRVDDTVHSERIHATSGRGTPCAPGSTDDVPKCDPTAPGANPAGAFLAGSTATAPGNRIEVQFLKNGRYLVICMNRGHSLNDHMFGFVSVVGDGDED